MKLEEQLEVLASVGIVLNQGITVDDILYSFSRQAYEAKPFDLLLFILGSEVEREPWGRPFCSRVWNFDTECIVQTGDYVKILQRLCEVADQPHVLSELEDFVDVESGIAWLKYKVGNIARAWPIEVNNDWADTLTLTYVMADIERQDRRFYQKENGQAMILFYLNATAAEIINQYSNNALKLVIPT